MQPGHWALIFGVIGVVFCIAYRFKLGLFFLAAGAGLGLAQLYAVTSD